MLLQLLRTLARRAAEDQPVESARVQPDPVPPPSVAELHAELRAVLASAVPAYPPGFQDTVPRRWYDESQNVKAIQAWIADRRATDPLFDAIAVLRGFTDPSYGRAASDIALALEYRAAGDKTMAMDAMAAALSCNHWDLYTQDIAEDIAAWAEGVANPRAAIDRTLEGRFCSIPFEMLETTPNGDAYVCCPSWLPIPIGNIEEATADSIWNSPIAQELRRSIADGSFRYCSRVHCIQITNNWLPSRASAEAQKYLAKSPEAPLPGPTKVILSHDQSCNLACPSCRRDYILADKTEQESLDRVMHKFVIPILRQAQSVRITGSGDPFASNHFRRVLKSLNRDDFPQLSIDLHTNGQLWNKRAWTELGLADMVIRNAEISIDAACPETYAVVRRGGDFNRLLENLTYVKSLRESGGVGSLYLSFVVQAGNFREMPAFVELAEQFGADLILFNMIRNWGTFSRDEFQSHFIGNRLHPEHAEFLKVLGSPALASAKVGMGNILQYVGAAPG